MNKEYLKYQAMMSPITCYPPITKTPQLCFLFLPQAIFQLNDKSRKASDNETKTKLASNRRHLSK
jgi:hypothetical protein